MKKINDYGRKNMISDRVKTARMNQHMAQGELAAKLQVMGVNIDQQMVSKIENGNRQVTDFELVCICRCLDVTLQWITQDFDLIVNSKK